MIGIFDGALYLDGRLVEQAAVLGRNLVWSDLPEAVCKATGLPPAGTLKFNPRGSTGSGPDGLLARRMRASHLSAYLSDNQSRYPELASSVVASVTATYYDKLDAKTLLNMSLYRTAADGRLADAVQEKVREDLNTLMLSCVDSELWKKLYPTVNQPQAQGYLADVLATNVDGKPSRKWYESLSTAVLVQGMAKTNDTYLRKLNTVRAGTWLNGEVAFSPVYQIHTKTLFSHAWQEKNPETKAFLDDQAKNTEDQKKTIDHRVDLWLKELEHSAALDAEARDKLIANIKQVGQYAKDNKRFWAFAIYSQLTFPTSWAFLQSAINSPGKDNSSELARMAQQHAALLDALDPSGYFAKKYFEIYQTLHITFALPQLLTLSGAQVDYDLIIDYLKQFIESNEKNTGRHDQVLLLKELLLEEEKTHTLQKSLDALVVLAAAGSGMAPFGSIMQQFAEQVFPKFVTNPKFQGLAKVLSVVIVGGITALTVWNLCLAFKAWDNLSANQRAEVIFNAVRMGTELVTALVVRGVQIYAVFSTSGLTGWQRMAALGKAAFGIESKALNKAVGKLGSRPARWLGSTGTQGMAAAGGAEAAEEASLLAKFMGPNLTKFVASAFGAIFVIIGLHFSIRGR
ncbi:hypothetical protein [Streptomyces sp. NPDC060131]|uniref:hypothetical protein n=2 Tax=Streptomyces TaxID=1883 RepID=UPI003656391C